MRYLILGPLEVRDGETEVALRGGQQRKLLAILLVHAGEAVSSDRLIDQLWEGKPPDTAAKALQGYVSSLRKQLGQETVETVGAGYRLNVVAADIDAREFEELLAEARPLERAPAAAKLREALALWRGPALADFAYDEFARPEIERLEELHLAGTERRIDLELALGHHDDLVPELEALVRAHQLRERLRGFLMVALYRSGRQAEALAAYRNARAVLRDELGLDPSEELQALQRAILAHDESLAAPPRVHVPGASGTRRRPERRRLRLPLIAVAVGLAILGGAAAAAALTQANGRAVPVVVPPNSVARIDRAGTRVESYVGVGRQPVAIALGAGGVWVANADDGTVTRLDPSTGKSVATIGVGADLYGVVVGFHSVWVADGNDGNVTRIDPRVNQVQKTLELGGRPTVAPHPVFYIAVDSRYVWATRGSELLRIDPRSDEVDGRVSIGTPTGLATGGGYVWVTTLSEQLLRIDARTMKKAGSQEFSSQTLAPVYARGSLWLIVGKAIHQVDPTSLAVGDPVNGTGGARGFPVALAVGDAALWTLSSDGDLTRFGADGRSGAPLQVGKSLSAGAAGGGATWVAVSATG